MSERVDDLAAIVWDYHLMHQKLEKADAIWALGSNHLCVAKYVVELWNQGWAPWIIYSGGVAHQDDLLRTGWDKPEADVFAQIGLEGGIPKEAIITEDKSTNTGENIRFTYDILNKRGIKLQKVILVQKPFMERRTYATFVKQWPGEKIEFSVTSPPITFYEYPKEGIDKDELINTMVGDLQRIKVYPEKGFQIYQEIPDRVWLAFEELVKLGYTKHLLKQ